MAEDLQPFSIVEDRGFKSVMKTGRPGYYLPSRTTVSRDVRLVFAHTRNHIAKMLQVSSDAHYQEEILKKKTYQEYSRKMSFTMDAWTSPNHKAFIAFSVHLEHEGKPLTILLDILEVAKVSSRTVLCNAQVLTYSQSHTGLEMATVFAEMLEDFKISDKVGLSSAYLALA